MIEMEGRRDYTNSECTLNPLNKGLNGRPCNGGVDGNPFERDRDRGMAGKYTHF